MNNIDQNIMKLLVKLFHNGKEMWHDLNKHSFSNESVSICLIQILSELSNPLHEKKMNMWGGTENWIKSNNIMNFAPNAISKMISTEFEIHTLQNIVLPTIFAINKFDVDQHSVMNGFHHCLSQLDNNRKEEKFSVMVTSNGFYHLWEILEELRKIKQNFEINKIFDLSENGQFFTEPELCSNFDQFIGQVKGTTVMLVNTNVNSTLNEIEIIQNLISAGCKIRIPLPILNQNIENLIYLQDYLNNTTYFKFGELVVASDGLQLYKGTNTEDLIEQEKWINNLNSDPEPVNTPDPLFNKGDKYYWN